MHRYQPKTFWTAALLGAILGGGALSGFAGAGQSYDATAGATATTPAPTPAKFQAAAKLKPSAGSRAKGSFTSVRTARKGTFGGVLSVPLPNPKAGIADAAAAEAAYPVLEIARQGQVYARCDLDFAGTASKSRVAKYRLNLVNRNGYLQAKTGYCKLSLDAGSPAPGLPKPLARDTLALKLVAADGERVLATGVFAVP
jgi:hypothetical protein